MQILIKTLTGSNNVFNVESSDSVFSLKEKIQEVLTISPDQQQLIFARKQLEDSQSLSFYSIQNDSTIHLALEIPGGIKISKKFPSGETIILPFSPEESINEIKKTLKEVYGYALNHQFLIHSGRELRGNVCIGYYGIPPGDVVTLVPFGKKKLGKVLKKIYKWSEGLALPMDFASLENRWQNKARSLVEAEGLVFEKDNQIYSLLSASSLIILNQLNTQLIQAKLSKQVKVITEKLASSIDKEFESSHDFNKSFEELFNQASIALLAKLSRYVPDAIEEFKEKVGYESIQGELERLLRKKAKEIHPEKISHIKNQIRAEEETKQVGVFEFSETVVTLSAPKPIIKHYQQKLGAGRNESKISPLTKDDRYMIVKTFLEGLENNARQLFDNMICNDNDDNEEARSQWIYESNRLSIAQLIILTQPDYYPREKLKSILSHLFNEEKDLLKLLTTPLDFSLENSAKKWLKSVTDKQRLETVLCIFLVLSNVYKSFIHGASETQDDKYTGVHRQWIRNIIHYYDSKLNNEFDWHYLLEIEQAVAKILAERFSKQAASSESDKKWVFNSEVVKIKEAFKAACLKNLDLTILETLSGLLNTNQKGEEDRNIEKSLESYEGLSYDEFELEKIVLDEPSFHITILIPGWLSANDKAKDYWKNFIVRGRGLTYALRWDSFDEPSLLKKGPKNLWDQFKSWWGGAEAFWDQLKQNIFIKSASQAEATGIMLAHLLSEGLFQNLTISLLGFSLGARVIHYCLKELMKINPNYQQIHDVYFLGGATPYDVESLAEIKTLVKGRMVNAYCESDWVLSYCYPIATFQKPVGTRILNVEGIESYNVTKQASGHLKYIKHLDEVLKKIEYNI